MDKLLHAIFINIFTYIHTYLHCNSTVTHTAYLSLDKIEKVNK